MKYFAVGSREEQCRIAGDANSSGQRCEKTGAIRSKYDKAEQQREVHGTAVPREPTTSSSWVQGVHQPQHGWDRAQNTAEPEPETRKIQVLTVCR